MSWDIFMPYKQMPSALFSADSALCREEAQGILALANEMGSTRRVYQYINVVVINCHVLSVFKNRSSSSLCSGRQKSKTQGLAKLISSDSTGRVYPSLFPSFRYFVNKRWYLLVCGHIIQISASVFIRHSLLPLCLSVS